MVIQISKASDKKDAPYLMFRVDRLCVDAGITVYGAAAQASLGGIQMVDKKHTGRSPVEASGFANELSVDEAKKPGLIQTVFFAGPSGEYLELLSSKSNADLMRVVYRQVRACAKYVWICCVGAPDTELQRCRGLSPQVSQTCPDFETAYRSIEQSVMFKVSSLRVVFDRTAVLYLNQFVQSVLTG